MDLNKAIQEIREYKRNLGQNCWLLGRRLIEIKESKVYLEQYGTFEEFLEKAVDISRESAYSYIKVSKEFDVELVTHWGIKKCRLLLSVEPNVRQEVVRIHKPTEPFSQLKETAQRLSPKAEGNFIDFSYFLEAEDCFYETLKKQKESEDYWAGCQANELFDKYPKKKELIELFKQLKEELK